MTPDLINGLFEICGGFFILLSILKLNRDKKVSGVSYLTVGFWTVWGLWNLYFYPHLGQTWSSWGAVGVVLTNSIYLWMLVYYSGKKPKGGVVAWDDANITNHEEVAVLREGGEL